MFDCGPSAQVDQFQARLGWPFRLTIWVHGPSRHERGVTDDHLGWGGLGLSIFGLDTCDVDTPPRDEQAVEREAAAWSDCYSQRVWAVRLPVQQADDRAFAIS